MLPGGEAEALDHGQSFGHLAPPEAQPVTLRQQLKMTKFFAQHARMGSVLCKITPVNETQRRDSVSR